MTDGQKQVIGHHSQKLLIHTSKKDKKIHLSHIANIKDGSTLNLNVHNHLWGCGGDKSDVKQGQIGERKSTWVCGGESQS